MLAYLPNVVAAVLLIVVGTSVSQFAGQTVIQAAEESGIEFARPLGRLVSGLSCLLIPHRPEATELVTMNSRPSRPTQGSHLMNG